MLEKYVVLVTTGKIRKERPNQNHIKPIIGSGRWRLGDRLLHRLKMVNPIRDTVKKTKRIITQLQEVVSS